MFIRFELNKFIFFKLYTNILASLSQQSFLPLSIGQLAAANAAVAQHQSDQDALLTHQRLVNQINHIQAAASNAVAVAAVAAVAQQRQATMESEQQASTVADGQEQKELNRKLSHNEGICHFPFRDIVFQLRNVVVIRSLNQLCNWHIICPNDMQMNSEGI